MRHHKRKYLAHLADWTVAAAVIAALAATPATAHALGGSPSRAGVSAASVLTDNDSPDTYDDPIIEATWYGPAVHLDWQNQRQTTTEATFVGDRTLVPGDQIARTLLVRNSGSEDGFLTVSIHADQTIQDEAVNPDFAQAVLIAWQVATEQGESTFAELIETGGQELVKVPFAHGETLSITITVTMPTETTVGNRDNAESAELSFDVRATISPTSTDPEPSESPTATPPPVESTPPVTTNPRDTESPQTSEPVPTGPAPSEPAPSEPAPSATPKTPLPDDALAHTGTSLIPAIASGVAILAASTIWCLKRRYPSDADQQQITK